MTWLFNVHIGLQIKHCKRCYKE